MRRLLTVGDSFTFGEELDDRKVSAYPYLLKNDLQFDEVVNLGMSGASSDYVFRQVIETLISGQKFDLVLVSWPAENRFEAIHNNPNFVPTNLKPHTEPVTCLIHKPGLINRPRKEPAWVQEYYKYSYETSWGFRKQFNQIIALQDFLKNRNQEYFMYNVAGLQGYYNEYREFLKNQFNAIDIERFVGWPIDGILEWQGNCVKGPRGHPLEFGHTRIAKVIKEHVSNFINNR
jgi:hypothetical protein